MTAFVLVLLAVLVGPVLWGLAGYPAIHGFVVLGAVAAVVLVLVAAPLAFLAYGRVKRGQADARGLTVAALVLIAAVPLVLAAEVVGSGLAFAADAQGLCAALAGQYESTVAADALTEATPGVGWPGQIVRARLMTAEYCPESTSLVASVERLLTGGY